MTSETKIRKANMQFASSGTWMTPEAKFREPNLYFMSLETGMTQCDKFEDTGVMTSQITDRTKQKLLNRVIKLLIYV